MSTFAVLVLVVSAVRIFADQDVKNATAAGSYGYEQPYSAPNYNGGYNYPPFYNGQYGPYGPYGPYGQFGPNFDVLKNSYVCSTDVAYGVYTSQNSAGRGEGSHKVDTLFSLLVPKKDGQC
ncbi:hypothetical protein GCK32_011327 [Trichostrongylus colubriformis]|uniref:Uncharacterized protein n=1 Tax=Trichostrongylus colubriformis TaxID=6319 RepID=A0AAN8IMC9_TRICO